MAVREPIDLPLGASSCLGRRAIVGVQNREVAGCLRGEDALFGACVVGKRAVPVKMIGSDVQDDGNFGLKLDGTFKLEAGDLEHGPGIGSTFFDEIYDGHADVSADERGMARGGENFTKQRSSGGFSVGAGDRQDAALKKA